MIDWMAGNLRRAALALLATSACHVFAIAQPPAVLATPATATAAADVILTSPLDYQVFQRETRLRGTIQIRGRLLAPADSVEARVAGRGIDGPLVATWHKLSLDQHTGEFRADLKTAAGGFYEVDVRVQHGAQRGVALTVPHVGVGEVFVVSGQSNSTNYGEVPQVTETGMVTTFSGEVWRLANDPQPGVQDNSKKGSFIPSFGDALYRRYRVPIGVASVGHGSTSVRQWLPAGEPVEVMPTMTKYIIQNTDSTLISDGTLFNGMMTRIRQLGMYGFRAVLWHQGESDSHQPPEHEIAAEMYRRMLEQVIQATRSQAEWNIPWFVAQATYHTPEDTSCPPIREAQRSLWQSGIAFEGPDTDTLTAVYRQNNGKGTHLNEAGLKAHG
jgi:Carbohydrate esterase, sialic acid-specific acetylesterase